ncbi:hypothetical protein HMPREF2965_14330, partial [Lactobacillus sp. HMSC075D02]
MAKDRAIMLEATYVLVYAHNAFASPDAYFPITRSPAQGSACKDLKRNGQARAITLKATYVPVYAHNAFASPE